METLNIIFLTISLLVAGSWAQEEPCPGGSDYWPDPDCNFYYACNSGAPIRLQCPTTPVLYWNQDLTVCDYPENVPECVGGTRPPIGVTTTTPGLTTPTTTSTTELPPTGSTNTATTTTTTTTTPLPPSSSTNPPITECPPEGELNIPYPGDCTLYTKCVQGIPIILRCPEGTLFDTQERICKPENIAVCTVIFYRRLVLRV